MTKKKIEGKGYQIEEKEDFEMDLVCGKEYESYVKRTPAFLPKISI